MSPRTCAKTGLRLIAAAGEEGFRVAKDRYGALTVLQNTIVGPLPITSTTKTSPDRRGRFDTLGSTVYFADSNRCAYAEVMVGFRKERAAIAKAAESIGWTVDDYIEQVIADARDNGVDVPWAISVDWQMERSIYRIQMPHHGWWVQMDHPNTLAALEALTPTVPGMTEVLQVLTAGSISGENRAVTTLLAEVIRQQVLDDGSEPLGISFPSKTLFGRCWLTGIAASTTASRRAPTTCASWRPRTSGPTRTSTMSPHTTICRCWAATPDCSGVQAAVA